MRAPHLMRSPHIKTELPGPKARALIERDRAVTTPSYPRDYPFVMGEPEPVRSLDAVPGLGDDDRELILSGNLATMANGVPYAIAAQIAHPERQVVAFVGDGGFSMLMAELATCVKYRLPVKVVVVKNNTLGQIKWEQMVFLGNPEYGCELQPIDFALFAQACGATGFTIEDPGQCGAVLDRALATPGPVVVQAVVDPLEPPNAAEDHRRAGAKVRDVLGPRGAQPGEDRPHRPRRPGARAGVTRAPSAPGRRALAAGLLASGLQRRGIR